ncbi:MAG: hypothetical protein ACOYL5_09290 [Phototrophicaceae bacterium]|jgi:hypothetical protein
MTYEDDLPELSRRPMVYVQNYARTVFGVAFHGLTEIKANAYRAFVLPSYFTLQPGNTEPSKSQWSTMKKRMKRINGGIFVFKQVGETLHNGARCYYVDFGYFKE